MYKNKNNIISVEANKILSGKFILMLVTGRDREGNIRKLNIPFQHGFTSRRRIEIAKSTFLNYTNHNSCLNQSTKDLTAR